MLTNEDVLKDRIKTLEGELQYIHDGWDEVKALKFENEALKSRVDRLMKQVKHLKQELEFE
jgi:predicted  nucleic acid-binding Zn-ribbon protein